MGHVLEVRRDEPRTARVVAAPAAALGDGQARFAVERFGLTANNITYTVLGDLLGYWGVFPAGEEGWGRPPAWGFATAVESRCAEVPEGTRVFGFVPMGGELVLTARSGPRGLLDTSAHRAGLSSVYNAYRPAEAGAHDDALMVLQPLFVTSVLLARHLAGARRVVLSSASSKTALGTAYLLRRSGMEVVGLTGSPDFVAGLDVYASVLDYDAVDELVSEPATFVDLAGDPRIRDSVHRRLGDALDASVLVGVTHMQPPAAEPPAGPEPTFFFAPDHLRDGLDPEALATVRELVGWAAGWLRIERRDGADAVLAAWTEAAGGELPPARALSLSLG